MMSGGQFLEPIAKYPYKNYSNLSGGQFMLYQSPNQDSWTKQEFCFSHADENLIDKLEYYYMLQCIQDWHNFFLSNSELTKIIQNEKMTQVFHLFNIYSIHCSSTGISYTKENKQELNNFLSLMVEYIVNKSKNKDLYCSAVCKSVENNCLSAFSLLIHRCPKQLDLNNVDILHTIVNCIIQNIKQVNKDSNLLNNSSLLNTLQAYDLFFYWEMLRLVLESPKVNPAISPLKIDYILNMLIDNNDINGACKLIKILIEIKHSCITVLFFNIIQTLKNKYKLNDLKKIPQNLTNFLELIKEFIPDNSCTSYCLKKNNNGKGVVTCNKCYILKLLEVI